MINAQSGTRRYAIAMRGIRHSQLSRRVQGQGAADQMRRLGDLVIACILLALTLPLMLIVALAIKWQSPGPALESRERIGQDGRRSRKLSFRTTVQKPGQLRSAWQKTQLGQFLENTRIDALPQLINVLRGDMSMADTSLFD
jgi:lipopolysaccharide/colanic/teichoic acid biosynthesis glycosyltransferase